MNTDIYIHDCTEFLKSWTGTTDCTFLDPPFNVGKHYVTHDDNMPPAEYWAWMTKVCHLVYERTSPGGAVYFMQREKHTLQTLKALEDSGWTFQNLIIWRKKSSAVPQRYRNAKSYQIIAFATKGPRPRVFNRLRIDPILLVTEKYERPNGMFVTDIWDDVRELTSGYYAGDEPLRDTTGKRLHEQQSPIALLLRILLSSTMPGDFVLDPFCGTGTTNIVAHQLGRPSVGIEKDPANVTLIKERLTTIRPVDSVERFRKDYRCTEGLEAVWSLPLQETEVVEKPQQVPSNIQV